ncbi:MAG TPA: F0F1 ATP synthase subunit B [Planctomycetota bacterium]|nr:F0F1 ATP synthase subunit B [Planctomycetota bacterium]
MVPSTASTFGVLASLAPALASSEGGFNPLDLGGLGGFLWTLVIFLVAAPFMWLMVMGPVTRALEERDSKAARAIVEAQKASGDAERARAEVEVALGEARAEAAKLMAAARDRAGVRERELIEAAKSEAADLVEGARRTIQAEQHKAIAAIREEVVDLAIAGAGKVLGRNVGGEDDRRLVAALVGQVKTGGGNAR